MNVTVLVDDVTLSTVVEEWGEEGHRTTVADKIVERITDHIVRGREWDPLRQRVERIRDEEIREQIKPIIAEAVSKPFATTNYYGEPTGQTTTLREVITAKVKDYLNNSSYGNRENNVQKIVREEVHRAMSAELREAIKSEREKVVAAVRAQAAELIADAVRQGVGGTR